MQYSLNNTLRFTTKLLDLPSYQIQAIKPKGLKKLFTLFYIDNFILNNGGLYAET